MQIALDRITQIQHLFGRQQVVTQVISEAFFIQAELDELFEREIGRFLAGVQAFGLGLLLFRRRRIISTSVLSLATTQRRFRWWVILREAVFFVAVIGATSWIRL